VANQYGGMKAEEVKRLKELEAENARLKPIVADKELEIDALRRFRRETGEPVEAAPSGAYAAVSARIVATTGLTSAIAVRPRK
jgi:hypothetical protein